MEKALPLLYCCLLHQIRCPHVGAMPMADGGNLSRPLLTAPEGKKPLVDLLGEKVACGSLGPLERGAPSVVVLPTCRLCPKYPIPIAPFKHFIRARLSEGK